MAFQVTCPHLGCGKTIQPQGRYCPNCGRILASSNLSMYAAPQPALGPFMNQPVMAPPVSFVPTFGQAQQRSAPPAGELGFIKKYEALQASRRADEERKRVQNLEAQLEALKLQVSQIPVKVNPVVEKVPSQQFELRQERKLESENGNGKGERLPVPVESEKGKTKPVLPPPPPAFEPGTFPVLPPPPPAPKPAIPPPPPPAAKPAIPALPPPAPKPVTPTPPPPAPKLQGPPLPPPSSPARPSEGPAVATPAPVLPGAWQQGPPVADPALAAQESDQARRLRIKQAGLVEPRIKFPCTSTDRRRYPFKYHPVGFPRRKHLYKGEQQHELYEVRKKQYLMQEGGVCAVTDCGLKHETDLHEICNHTYEFFHWMGGNNAKDELCQVKDCPKPKAHKTVEHGRGQWYDLPDNPSRPEKLAHFDAPFPKGGSIRPLPIGFYDPEFAIPRGWPEIPAEYQKTGMPKGYWDTTQDREWRVNNSLSFCLRAKPLVKEPRQSKSRRDQPLQTPGTGSIQQPAQQTGRQQPGRQQAAPLRPLLEVERIVDVVDDGPSPTTVEQQHPDPFPASKANVVCCSMSAEPRSDAEALLQFQAYIEASKGSMHPHRLTDWKLWVGDMKENTPGTGVFDSVMKVSKRFFKPEHAANFLASIKKILAGHIKDVVLRVTELQKIFQDMDKAVESGKVTIDDWVSMKSRISTAFCSLDLSIDVAIEDLWDKSDFIATLREDGTKVLPKEEIDYVLGHVRGAALPASSRRPQWQLMRLAWPREFLKTLAK